MHSVGCGIWDLAMVFLSRLSLWNGVCLFFFSSEWEANLALVLLAPCIHIDKSIRRYTMFASPIPLRVGISLFSIPVGNGALHFPSVTIILHGKAHVAPISSYRQHSSVFQHSFCINIIDSTYQDLRQHPTKTLLHHDYKRSKRCSSHSSSSSHSRHPSSPLEHQPQHARTKHHHHHTTTSRSTSRSHNDRRQGSRRGP